MSSIIDRQKFMEDVKSYKEKLSKIKVCAFDVDGVMTTSQIWWDEGPNGFNRGFHTLDGYALKVLKRAGYKVGVISGGDSLGVKKRFVENLKLDFAFLGSEDKREAYKKLLELEDGLTDENILYMGDEFFDVPLLKRAGFSACPPESSFEVQDHVDYVSQRSGGHACVREVIDLLRTANDIMPKVEDFDGSLIF